MPGGGLQSVGGEQHGGQEGHRQPGELQEAAEEPGRGEGVQLRGHAAEEERKPRT